MPRRIAVFCDGTWNTPDQRHAGAAAPTNVCKLRDVMLTADPIDGTPQLKYYRRGVGNDGFVDRWLGGGLGRGLDRNLADAYDFVCTNYAAGDELYLFGFSRGAYTARSLAGLIRNAGVLRPGAGATAGDAIRLYRSRSAGDHPRGENAVRFRQAHAHEVDVHFIGVWDTVGALGIPGALGRATPSGRYAFHDVELSSHVRFAYQALAIDERRRSFRPTLWKPQASAAQVVEQVWFPGVHSDIGGGYATTALSDTACLWLAERAAAAGLALDLERLRENVRPDPLGRMHDEFRGMIRFLGTFVRPVCAGPAPGCERVHESARARRAAQPPLSPPYDPPNLPRP